MLTCLRPARPDLPDPDLPDTGWSEASQLGQPVSAQEGSGEHEAASLASHAEVSDQSEGGRPVVPVASSAATEPEDDPVAPIPGHAPEQDRLEHAVSPVPEPAAGPDQREHPAPPVPQPAAIQDQHEHAVTPVPEPAAGQDRHEHSALPAPEPAARPGQHQHPALPAPGHEADRDRYSHPFAPAASVSERPAQPQRPPAAAADGRGTTVSRSASGQGNSLPADSRPAHGPGPAGPHLTADGSWTWGPASLTPDQVRVAEDAYDRFRAAEGRSLFGSYTSSGLTTTLRRIEGRLEHGQLAPDTEQRALLSADIFRARFADLLGRHPDRRPELVARRVPGAISYSFIFEAEQYADGIRLVQEALEVQGFQLQARKNSWSSLVNRCVFTVWRDPLNDLPFEVQFHTPASVEARQLARTSAALIRDPRIPSAEAANLQSDLASTWAALPSPPGNAEISDFRRDGSRAPGR